MKKFIRQFIVFFLLVPVISCVSAPGPEPISYATAPSTEGELSVAHTLESIISSYNDKDIDKHIYWYAPDARIDSKLAGGFVTRDEYSNILQKSGRLTTIRLKDTTITKVSDNKYRVDAILSTSRGTFPITYFLVPLEGKWYIIEQKYK